MATLVAFSLVVFVSLSSMDSPRGDGFADNLTIPEGIEIADPDLDVSRISLGMADMGSDEWQDLVRKALAEPGDESTEFSPRIPSLRKASIDYADTLIDYLEASPNWHVFLERGNRFAFRRWSYGGEPRDTLLVTLSFWESRSSLKLTEPQGL